MKKMLLLLSVAVLFACNKNESPTTVPPQDPDVQTEQLIKELEAISANAIRKQPIKTTAAKAPKWWRVAAADILGALTGSSAGAPLGPAGSVIGAIVGAVGASSSLYQQAALVGGINLTLLQLNTFATGIEPSLSSLTPASADNQYE
jgi:hypothetical protein